MGADDGSISDIAPIPLMRCTQCTDSYVALRGITVCKYRRSSPEATGR